MGKIISAFSRHNPRSPDSRLFCRIQQKIQKSTEQIPSGIKAALCFLFSRKNSFFQKISIISGEKLKLPDPCYFPEKKETDVKHLLFFIRHTSKGFSIFVRSDNLHPVAIRVFNEVNPHHRILVTDTAHFLMLFVSFLKILRT